MLCCMRQGVLLQRAKPEILFGGVCKAQGASASSSKEAEPDVGAMGTGSPRMRNELREVSGGDRAIRENVRGIEGRAFTFTINSFYSSNRYTEKVIYWVKFKAREPPGRAAFFVEGKWNGAMEQASW